MAPIVLVISAEDDPAVGTNPQKPDWSESSRQLESDRLQCMRNSYGPISTSNNEVSHRWKGAIYEAPAPPALFEGGRFPPQKRVLVQAGVVGCDEPVLLELDGGARPFAYRHFWRVKMRLLVPWKESHHPGRPAGRITAGGVGCDEPIFCLPLVPSATRKPLPTG